MSLPPNVTAIEPACVASTATQAPPSREKAARCRPRIDRVAVSNIDDAAAMARWYGRVLAANAAMGRPADGALCRALARRFVEAGCR